jgi:dipeptidyl aminopeptidase/acylaminoacyl peptidase
LKHVLFLAAPLLGASLYAQSGDIAPNENLLADGIPPIPSSVAEAVGRYADFRAASFQAWNPAKREMLVLTRFGDTNQIHRVKMPGGDRTQLTFFPDRVSGASFPPAGRGDFFVFSKDVGGGEFFQLYRYDVATAAVTLLTDGKSRNTGGAWSTKGEAIAYASTRRNGKDSDLYVMSPADPRTDRRLAEVESGGWGVLDWSPDDKTVVVGEFLSVNESHLWLFDVATGERKRLTPESEGEPAGYFGARFAPDGKSVYTVTDKDSEWRRLARVDVATGAHRYLTSHVSWDVQTFDLSPDGRTLAFETNEDGASVLRLLDTATGRETPGPKLPKGVLSGLEWHPDGTVLGFTLSSARSPADAYSFTPASRKLERWTESETGGLDAATFVEPELVRWKSFDGRTISGFLYKPPASFTGKRPVVVEVHGGPESQARPGFLGRSNYWLNELGVARLFPNVRGSTGYGKTFLKLDNGMLREDSVKDIGALLDWIGTNPDLDPARVMVTGGSYGGYMTLASATHFDERLRCSLSVVGVSNFVTFLERTEAYRRDLRRAEYGDEREPKMREFLERSAPLNNVAKITKPLFVVQGKNDPRVPWTESEQMVAALKKDGRPVWYLLARDEGHGFAKRKNQDFQLYATVAFVRRFLLD